MRLIFLLPVLALCACTAETRTSWEQSPQFRHTTGIEVPPVTPGTVRVAYPDSKPAMGFGSTVITCETGIHVNEYDQNGVLVSHRWQADEVAK